MNAAASPTRRSGSDHQPDPTLEQLQTLIAAAIAELLDLVATIKAGDTQRSGRGFLTVEARKVMDGQIVAEQGERERRFRNLKAWERAWFPPAIKGAPSVAPVPITPVSLVGEIHDYFIDLCDRLQRRMARHHHLDKNELAAPGAGSLVDVLLANWHPAADASGRPILSHLASYATLMLTKIDDPARLQPIHRDLEDLTAKANRFVNGSDAMAHPEPCPHCGLHTLVIYRSQTLIRCEGDPHTGRRQPCVCSDSYCECKRHPVAFRHEWLQVDPRPPRKPGEHRPSWRAKSGSWDGLRIAQNAAQRQRDEDTK